MKEGVMFTGIIESLGQIAQKTHNQLTIKSSGKLVKQLSLGLSISVDGICLTVVDLDQNTFTVDFMPETYQKTNIKNLKVGNLVNLELPATPQTYLSGHIVYGHVDGVAKLLEVKKTGNSQLMKFAISKKLSHYLVEKGSVALNGISLTVIEAGNNYFTIGIIPHTFKNTNLKDLKKGNLVNLEADILAKYLSKLKMKN